MIEGRKAKSKRHGDKKGILLVLQGVNNETSLETVRLPAASARGSFMKSQLLQSGAYVEAKATLAQQNIHSRAAASQACTTQSSAWPKR